MTGFAPLRPSELEAWARLKGVRLRPHEAEALLLLDSVLHPAPEPSTP